MPETLEFAAASVDCHLRLWFCLREVWVDETIRKHREDRDRCCVRVNVEACEQQCRRVAEGAEEAIAESYAVA